METLERFQQSQRVIEDFTTHTLAAIPSEYGRLYYVASLRDGNGGVYRHDGLTTLYSPGAVQQALEHCHAELFCKVLETPLDRQEWDLRACLCALDRDLLQIASQWLSGGSYLSMVPSGLPAYLSELFRSNLTVLLCLFAEETASLQGAA